MSDASANSLFATEPDLSLMADFDVENDLRGLAQALGVQGIERNDVNETVEISDFKFNSKPAFGVCVIELKVAGETNPRKLQVHSKDELLGLFPRLLEPEIANYFVIDDYDHDIEDLGMHSDV